MRTSSPRSFPFSAALPKLLRRFKLPISSSVNPFRGSSREFQREMKATVKGRYEAEKSSAAATLSASAGDLRLKASFTDATLLNASSFNGLSLSIEKPAAFIVDFNLPKKDVRFQFMNTVRVLEKSISLTYTHARGDNNRTALDGSLAFDPANKVSVSYVFDSGNCKVKYAYAHGELRRTVFEPSYDLSKNAWDFAVSRKFEGGDSVKATYQTSAKMLGLEWNRDSAVNGAFKISASMNLAEEKIVPKLVAESTWNFEM